MRLTLLLILFFLLISNANGVNTVSASKDWKAGTTEKIEITTDTGYSAGTITIEDKDSTKIIEDVLYSPEDNLWIYNYYIPTNAKGSTYYVKISMDRGNGIVDDKSFTVNVIGLNLFDKLVLWIKTLFGI